MPDVTRFELNGADHLNITDYKHDQLTLMASGRAEIQAKGETKSVKLSVSGGAVLAWPLRARATPTARSAVPDSGRANAEPGMRIS